MAIRKGVKAAREARKNVGGNKYLKLDDGDAYLIAFTGVFVNGEDEEPLAVEVVWKDGRQGRYSELYDETKHNEDDIKTQFVWQVAAVDVSDLDEDEAVPFEKAEMKILQQGAQIFDQFIKHRDGRKGIKYWFELSREGKGQFDTKYHLERDDKLTDEDMARFKGMELFDLEKEVEDSERDEEKEEDEPKKRGRRGRRRRSEEAPKTMNKREASDLRLVADDGETISLEQLAKLRSSIKALEDMEAGQVALAKEFTIQRLQDLPAAHFEAALNLIMNLEKPAPAAAAGDGLVADEGEDDPFM